VSGENNFNFKILAMIEIIRNLPKQIKESFEFPTYKLDMAIIDRIVICGMGGSAIAGDFLKSYLYYSSLPVEIIRDYKVPQYVNSTSLVFVISYSGNTEETISAFENAFKNGSKIIVITSGGKLKELAEKYEIPVVLIPRGLPPRGAIGYIFSSILLNLERNGIIQVSRELKESLELLDKSIKEFDSTSSIAFEIANKFYLRIPIIYSSQRLFSVAYRWQTQINENAKSFCHMNVIPEMNHNEINGLKNPKDIISKCWVLFMFDIEDDERIKRRIEIVSEIIKDSVLGITILQGKGETFLHRMLYLILLGDYVSYYLSRFYNEDPYAIPRIEELKRKLEIS
jgi:glucose/mannose-6-phosphate isomerase